MDTSVKFPPTASATMANPSAAFLANATIEVTGKQIEKFPLLKDNMPAGATVFIALIEAQDLWVRPNRAYISSRRPSPGGRLSSAGSWPAVLRGQTG